LKKDTLKLNNIIRSFHTKLTSSNWWSLVELYLGYENYDITCSFYLFKAILDHDYITVIILLFITLSVIDCFRLICTFSPNASRQRNITKKVDLVFFKIRDFEHNTILNIFIDDENVHINFAYMFSANWGERKKYWLLNNYTTSTASHWMLDACGRIRPYFNLRASTKIIFL